MMFTPQNQQGILLTEDWEKENWVFELPTKHIAKIKALIRNTAKKSRKETLEEVIEFLKIEKCCCGQSVCDSIIKLQNLTK